MTSLQQVAQGVKEIIADVKNINPADVLQKHTLRGDLGFTNVGVRALAPHINIKFSNAFEPGTGITPAEAGTAMLVRDLTELIWGEVSVSNRG